MDGWASKALFIYMYIKQSSERELEEFIHTYWNANAANTLAL